MSPSGLLPAAIGGSGLILAIETSCDETAAAVVRRGEQVLSSVISSQAAVHAAYGGVVPEIASREHLRQIVPVVRAAMREAGIALADLDAVAVTEGPGLAGALLVGILYAKALAFGLGKPLIAVNHLEGHIHAVLLEGASRSGAGIQQPPGDSAAPLLALVVSGGHTHLYLAFYSAASGAWTYRNVGRTVDDAAGEAFDKVAKLLGLGYPGGPWIDALATYGDSRTVPFNFHSIKPRDADAGARFDFSFSGIKTAVLRYVQNHQMQVSIETRRAALAAEPRMLPAAASAFCDVETLNLIASFQGAVVGNLLRQTFAAAKEYGACGLLISGGVAANSELRVRFARQAAELGLWIAFPSFSLSTDNAAMIGAAAWPRFLNGEFAASGMSAAPQLKLG